MYFTEIGETVKIELYADGVRLLQRACEIAAESGRGTEYGILAGAFEAAGQVIAARASGYTPAEKE
jgi:hypothetical protein